MGDKRMLRGPKKQHFVTKSTKAQDLNSYNNVSFIHTNIFLLKKIIFILKFFTFVLKIYLVN
jgi:hypothetical protein